MNELRRMSNPTLELIHQHGSVRKYKPDPVPQAMIETIVSAAQRSSTSSNLQMYSVVAVTDATRRGDLQTLCGDQQFITQAPVFLAWCADLSRLERICMKLGYAQESGLVENFLLAAVDTALAMQTAGLAAESLGLGFCFIGAIRNHPKEVIDLLELPRLVFPLAGMTLGWPVAPPHLRPRLPLEAVLHWERYDPRGEEQHLETYDQAMIATGIYRGRQVRPPAGETTPPRPYGWQEHSARRVSRPVRAHLRQVLFECGFELK